MKKYLALTAGLVLAACNTTTDPAATAQPTVVDTLIGKTLVAGEATFIFNADGTVGGNFPRGPVEGTYDATATEVCSSYTSPANLVGLGELCSVPVIENGTVVFNRSNGTQSPIYTIQG